MTTTLQPKRTVAVYTMPRRLRLREALAALGVGVADQVTRSHLHSAHQIFRQAKGGSVEVNSLWSFIKQHICPVCEGVKLQPKAETCSPICARSKNKPVARTPAECRAARRHAVQAARQRIFAEVGGDRKSAAPRLGVSVRMTYRLFPKKP